MFYLIKNLYQIHHIVVISIVVVVVIIICKFLSLKGGLAVNYLLEYLYICFPISYF